MSLRPVSSVRKRFEFNWDILDIVLRGKSAIDLDQGLAGFQIGNLESVQRFLKSYGYDLDDPIEKAEVFGNFHESINFIRRYFLQPENPEGLKLEVPRKILEITDIRELFLLSAIQYPGQTADSKGVQLRDWACAVLKVMHTIAHTDKDLRTPYFTEIQKQICDRFYKVVQRDEAGQLFLGEKADDVDRVDLVAFESKPKKTRDSVLLKLMHKPENVAEDIFDRVGIRFVTRTRAEALRVVKYLKDHLLIMPPNIKSSRSKNNLVDLDWLKRELEESLVRADRGELAEEDIVAKIEEGPLPGTVPDETNPHSSQEYRAIQFTSRRLIKLKNPVYDDLKELKTLEKTLGEEDPARKVLERIDLKHIQRAIRFFYPYEIQVFDQKSAEENELGRSSHAEYKRSQVLTAMKRVMGNLVHAER